MDVGLTFKYEKQSNWIALKNAGSYLRSRLRSSFISRFEPLSKTPPQNINPFEIAARHNGHVEDSNFKYSWSFNGRFFDVKLFYVYSFEEEPDDDGPGIGARPICFVLILLGTISSRKSRHVADRNIENIKIEPIWCEFLEIYGEIENLEILLMKRKEKMTEYPKCKLVFEFEMKPMWIGEDICRMDRFAINDDELMLRPNAHQNWYVREILRSAEGADPGRSDRNNRCGTALTLANDGILRPHTDHASIWIKRYTGKKGFPATMDYTFASQFGIKGAGITNQSVAGILERHGDDTFTDLGKFPSDGRGAQRKKDVSHGMKATRLCGTALSFTNWHDVRADDHPQGGITQRSIILEGSDRFPYVGKNFARERNQEWPDGNDIIGDEMIGSFGSQTVPVSSRRDGLVQSRIGGCADEMEWSILGLLDVQSNERPNDTAQTIH